ncbi:SAM-dependent methyltransferase [Nocardia thailandica]|uniref:SAM-dependent methyltransferase n=1 Tax=Nocardia thailandica TaxID=257275 RepID=UPI0002E0E649|nr:SAM-dependent methyltransferase [Nocardia thailandica]
MNGLFQDFQQNVPSSARVGNLLLGGKDNYEIDRTVARQVSDRIVVAVCEARRFLLRAVEHLSNEHDVHQYVDLGCGIPLPPDIGDIAGRNIEQARVLYLDNDPLVAAHARALLANTPNRHFAQLDITDTATVLTEITAFLDPAEPIALCLSGTAELLVDPSRVLAELTNCMPATNWVILSHLTDDIFGDKIRRWAEDLTHHGIPYQPRDRATVTAMLAPYQLLEPGLVSPHHWRPDLGSSQHQAFHPSKYDLSAYAAVGRRTDRGDT